MNIEILAGIGFIITAVSGLFILWELSCIEREISIMQLPFLGEDDAERFYKDDNEKA